MGVTKGNWRLGVDVGGTFTDLMAVKEDGEIRIGKVPSRVESPFDAISEGLTQMDLHLGNVSLLSFGTTIATNTVIERNGLKTALVYTKGFRDILDHQRWHRQHLYDLQQTRPAPLVPRVLRFGIGERVASTGEVLVEVDPREVDDLVEALRAQQVASVAVSFLNSYRNPVNEESVGRLIRERADDIHVSLSSEIAPLIREWERTSTTVVNAYVCPVIERHLSGMEARIREASPDLTLHIMQSNGGVISVEQASSQPVRTVLSGPAAGVVGAVSVGEAAGEGNLITLDMGGTSCDVALVQDGAPQVSKEGQLSYNVPITVPMLDVKTIGAGGGSLVWIDSGGMVKVGPQSAGAVPGPACYERGGTRATVTDAQLLLGRIPSSGLLGGQMDLSASLAEKALGTIAGEVDLSVPELAGGVVRIANVMMAEAVRMITVNHGLDPRDFALLAFGGAGPLHACEIAEELQVPKVLVPASAGVLSAGGLAGAGVKIGGVKALNISLDDISPEGLEEEYLRLENRCIELLDEHEVPSDQRTFVWSADVRYRHQSFEVTVQAPRDELHSLAELFGDSHQRLYHYSLPEEKPFLVNVEVTARGNQHFSAVRRLPRATTKCEPTDSRKIFVLQEGEWVTADVFQRDLLEYGHRISGPAVIDQLDSTVIVLPGYVGEVDQVGTLILTREGAFS